MKKSRAAILDPHGKKKSSGLSLFNTETEEVVNPPGCQQPESETNNSLGVLEIFERQSTKMAVNDFIRQVAPAHVLIALAILSAGATTLGVALIIATDGAWLEPVIKYFIEG